MKSTICVALKCNLSFVFDIKYKPDNSKVILGESTEIKYAQLLDPCNLIQVGPGPMLSNSGRSRALLI